ncbi:MAG: DNA internalization-related competence protein ComEC/Rec2 [Gammaproteobacteria bacterium]|nr:MAG: DNA internalization-related competence protein ComEC/Rec2 [Gammaproteobacteria bacterium]
MIAKTLAFVAGVLLLQLVPVLPPWYCYLPVPVFLAYLCRHALWLPAVFVFGFFWAAVHAELAFAPELPSRLEGRTVLVEGRAVDIPRHLSGQNYRFAFAAERLHDGESWQEFPLTIRLSWYRTATVPSSGERWQLAVRLKRPHGYANPGGFDFERWLFLHRMRATGYVRKDSRNRLLQDRQADPVGALRSSIAGQFSAMSDTGTTLGLIRALIIGDRNAVTPAQWEILRATGTSHLMAISGLHISLVSGLVFLLVRFTWARSGRLTEILPAARAAAILALGAGFGYAVLAGFGIPTRRALVMLGVAMLALLSGRYVRPAHVLCVAVTAVLLLDPLSVLAPGWWLSFWAVTLIVYTTAGRHGQEGIWGRWIRVHVVLAISLAPLLLALFQQASLIAPLANVVAVPWTGLLVVPLALLGGLLVPVSPWASEQVLGLAAWLLDALWPYLVWLGGLDFAMLQQQPPAWTLLPATAGILLLFAPRGTPGRWTGSVLLLPLLVVIPPAPATGAVWATLLDVGQGLSVVVRTRQHTLVYDAGASHSPTFDTGRVVVVPFLRSQGISRVDRLVVSHDDNDHAGGVPSLLGAVPVDELLSGVPGVVAGRQALACHYRGNWMWDGVEFEVLHPGEGYRQTGNNASCVIRITAAGGQRLLLTGDIEIVVEQALLRESRDALPAAVLIVPHHGSLTSSSPAFIRAIAPNYALFPVGYRNRYGLPREPVVERYRAVGAQLFDSIHHGAIDVRLPATTGDVVVTGWRCQRRHYWRDGACGQ